MVIGITYFGLLQCFVIAFESDTLTENISIQYISLLLFYIHYFDILLF